MQHEKNDSNGTMKILLGLCLLIVCLGFMAYQPLNVI